MAFAGNAGADEQDSAGLMVAEWEKHGALGQGTTEVRGMIQQPNAVEDAEALKPVASDVPATKQPGDETGNQVTMMWRLARQLLCLHRVADHSILQRSLSVTIAALKAVRFTIFVGTIETPLRPPAS